jgi:hypothetical protein
MGGADPADLPHQFWQFRSIGDHLGDGHSRGCSSMVCSWRKGFHPATIFLISWLTLYCFLLMLS